MRALTTPKLEKRYPWAFFDGASQGEAPIGGVGGVIYLTKIRKISFKLALGKATNSKAELTALWTTLKLAKDKQISRSHIYGDSKSVIDWEISKNNIRALHLHNLLNSIHALQPSFEVVSFKHIYREHNSEADTLSKLALAIHPGIIEGEITINREVSLFYTKI